MTIAARCLSAVSITVVLASSVLSSSVEAQVKQDSTREQQPVVLPGIVVTATLVPVPAVTAAVTIVTGDELRARGIEHVLDALREVPGATVVQTGSFGGLTSLYLRGGESGYVHVLIDGTPVNQPGGDFDFANLTTENIDRIEIVRGPASVLYGSDAITGVVQIFTRRGQGSLHADVSVRGGNYGTRAVDVTLSGGARTASYSFNGARFLTDGIYAFNDQYQHSLVSGLVHLTPDERTDARVSLQYSNDNTHVPTNDVGQIVDHNAFAFSERVTIGLELSRFFTQQLQVQVLATSNGTDGGFNNQPDSAADTLGFYAFQSLDAIRRRSVDARANLHVSSNAVLTAGAQVGQETERSFDDSKSQYGSSHDLFDVTRRNRAFYAEVVDHAGALSWNVGARVDDNDTFGTFFTFRGGVAYQLPTGTRVRGVAGNAFREPTFFENFAQGIATGNRKLRPEHSRNWEVGLEQRLLRDQVWLAATYFNQHFQDLIEYTLAPPNPGDPNYYNIAGANADGVELEARVSNAVGLSLRAAYTYLHTLVANPGFDTSGTGFFVPNGRLLRRPTHTTSATVGYRWGAYGTVQLGVNFVGNRDDLDYTKGERVVLPGYTKIDVAGEYGLLGAHAPGRAVRLTARLDNALNAHYQAAFGYPSPGRTLLMGMRFGLGL